MNGKTINSVSDKWYKRTVLLAGTALCVYLLVLIYYTLLPRNHYRFPDLRLNFVPFEALRNIARFQQLGQDTDVRNAIRNLYGNILLYMPFGFLLPVAVKKLSSFIKVLASAFTLSFTVELLQGLIYLGVSDIDDIILQVIGACAGYCVYRLAVWLLHKIINSGSRAKVQDVEK